MLIGECWSKGACPTRVSLLARKCALIIEQVKVSRAVSADSSECVAQGWGDGGESWARPHTLTQKEGREVWAKKGGNVGKSKEEKLEPKRALQFDGVPALPGSARGGMLCVRTREPIARKLLCVGETVPRFAADEGRSFALRCPHQPSWGRRCHASDALLLGIEHINGRHLMLIEDQSFVEEGVDGEGHEGIKVVVCGECLHCFLTVVPGDGHALGFCATLCGGAEHAVWGTFEAQIAHGGIAHGGFYRNFGESCGTFCFVLGRT